MFILNDMPTPIDGALIAKLQRVETATVGHFRQQGFMDRGIQAVIPDKRIAGTAVTLAIPGQDSTLLHHVLGLLRPGDFLVIDRLGDDRHACWGGGVTVAAKASGASGGVVDGPCTDFSEVRQQDFPLWCRGPSPITTRLYGIGGAWNVPVSCGGVTVNPGDAVLADESGVLVLSPEVAAEVADTALAKQKAEPATFARIHGGEKLGDISGATEMVLAKLGDGKSV